MKTSHALLIRCSAYFLQNWWQKHDHIFSHFRPNPKGDNSCPLKPKITLERKKILFFLIPQQNISPTPTDQRILSWREQKTKGLLLRAYWVTRITTTTDNRLPEQVFCLGYTAKKQQGKQVNAYVKPDLWKQPWGKGTSRFRFCISFWEGGHRGNSFMEREE